ncbi:unnamed protein product [Urochloa humidicola]
MWKSKRGGGDLSSSFCKNRRAWKTDWVLGRLCDEDFNEDVGTKLSNDFSKNIVSICLCNGTVSLFSCSGIAIAREGYLTRFLTSASLVRAFDGKTIEHYFDLKISVS